LITLIVNKRIATWKNKVSEILRLIGRVQQTTPAKTKVKQMVTPLKMIIYR
jgi:hypothetical protein